MKLTDKENMRVWVFSSENKREKAKRVLLWHKLRATAFLLLPPFISSDTGARALYVQCGTRAGQWPELT